MLIGGPTAGERQNIVYDLLEEDVKAVSSITMRFNFDGEDCAFLNFRTGVIS